MKLQQHGRHTRCAQSGEGGGISTITMTTDASDLFHVDVDRRRRSEILTSMLETSSCTRKTDVLLEQIRCIIAELDDGGKEIGEDELPRMGNADDSDGTDSSSASQAGDPAKHARLRRELPLSTRPSSKWQHAHGMVPSFVDESSCRDGDDPDDEEDEVDESSIKSPPSSSCDRHHNHDDSLDMSLSSISTVSIGPVGILRRSCRFGRDQKSGSSTLLVGGSSHHSQTRFSMADEIIEVPKIPNDLLDDVFYDDDEIAQFRYEAFCEEIGVDPDDDGFA
jgi:hypothetical protein